MFITSLHMRHWRNFRGPVDVRLRRRAFLIGPNASGKSNVLDVLRLLRDTAGHGLKEAVRLRGGVGEIRTLQARTPAGLEVYAKRVPREPEQVADPKGSPSGKPSPRVFEQPLAGGLHFDSGRRLGGESVLGQREQPSAGARETLSGLRERPTFARGSR